MIGSKFHVDSSRVAFVCVYQSLTLSILLNYVSCLFIFYRNSVPSLNKSLYSENPLLETSGSAYQEISRVIFRTAIVNKAL